MTISKYSRDGLTHRREQRQNRTIVVQDIIASAIMLGFGLWWLSRAEARLETRRQKS